MENSDVSVAGTSNQGFEKMPEKVKKKFNVCDPELAWDLCRETVGSQLLGKGPLIVPFKSLKLKDFTISGVILNSKKNLVHSLGRSGNHQDECKLIGNIREFVSESSENVEEFENITKEKPVDNQRYAFKCQNIDKKGKREIVIRIWGCLSRCVKLDKERIKKVKIDLQAHEVLKNVNKLYIIDQLFIATKVQISALLGLKQTDSVDYRTETSTWTSPESSTLPVAFTVQKFSLEKPGFLKSEVMSSSELKKVYWKRVPHSCEWNSSEVVFDDSASSRFLDFEDPEECQISPNEPLPPGTLCNTHAHRSLPSPPS